MAYKKAEDLDNAVKAAAKASSMDTGRAYVGFFFHRLLCRVFSDSESRFLLKGGQSMLARTVDARSTRDVDLLSEDANVENAVEELVRLASIDMDDFVTFALSKVSPIKTDDEYRSGVKVAFHVQMGRRKVQDISIDLVVDEIPQEGFDTVTPADRIEVRGIPTCDYRVYTVESALADKFFGITERHEGRPSSRQKDLVDVIVYARSCEVDGSALSRRLRLESAARDAVLPIRFEIPGEWRGPAEARFHKLCEQTPIVADVASLDCAVEIAASLFNPVLDESAHGKTWNPSLKEWT